MLEIKELSLVKRGKNILKKISLQILPGRATLLLGKSGSGKTSILRSISQVEQKYEGEIRAGAEQLKLLSPRERCRMIGFVPQSHALFPHLNVLDNCAYPFKILLKKSKQEARAQAKDVLQSLGMQEYAKARPHELSGGQQQRAAIARALMLRPDYLLLDEPTSALDPENTEILVNILDDLKSQGTGMIISSQDMAFARKMLDRVVFLQQGSIVECWDFQESTTVPIKTEEFLHAHLR